MNEALPKKPAEIEPTQEQREVAEAFVFARLLRDDDDIPPLAQLLAEREHKLQERIDELEEENGEFALHHDLSVDEDNERIADMLECRANIHDLMDKMALLMEGVAEGWSDGLDNKGSAAFFAVEEAQQVYTRCAARYGTPEVSRSCESGEGEAEDDEPGPRSDLPECKMPPAMAQVMLNNAVHLPISLLSPEEVMTPTIRSIPVVVDASIPEGGPQVIVSGCPFDEAVKG